MEVQDKTKLTFRFIGEIEFSFDDSVTTADRARFEITQKAKIEIAQLGFPNSTMSEFWVQALMEKQIDYAEDPFAYYVYLKEFCDFIRQHNGKDLNTNLLIPDAQITATNPFGRLRRFKRWLGQLLRIRIV